MKSNSIITLNLYKSGTTWCFDDDVFAIKREPFVLGMSEIITSYLPENTETCTLLASNNEFPNSSHLRLDKEEANGGWYTVTDTGMKGWLCPVTRIYMQGIPENIYFQIIAK
jgi:hypothetical protein